MREAPDPLAPFLGLRPWLDPEVVAMGRLPMRSPLVGHPGEASALAGREASPWFLPLGGQWRFRYLERPEDLTPADVHRDVDLGDWATIDVPGHWSLQGWDRPHYTNIRMPFPGRPPQVPPANPTGVHRTAFRLPAAWKGRRVVLHVGSAESVLAVWVNGRWIGLGTDSRLGQEFDVTAMLRRGVNELVLVVVKWSAQSYVEDQDHWWLGGLAREVFLRSVGPVHVADVRVDAGLDDDLTTGTLRLRTTVGFAALSDVEPGWTVEARLTTMAGRHVGRVQRGDVPVDLRPHAFRGHVVDLGLTVPRVAAWSAESPNRYRLVVTLRSPLGEVAEVVAETVGFRRVEVRGRELLVNGQPVMIRGVNRHDHHPQRGKAVTVDDARADLVTMKRHNVNAVRTSHYPNDPSFLDLCDELGLYVVDEADLEAHAFNDSLNDDPRYRTTWLERVARMAQRDKNHACVVMWSLGNEAGYGVNHEAAAGFLRAYDPTRPLHYEGAVMHTWRGSADKGGHSVTDVVCPMYPPIDELVDAVTTTSDPRPWILCEYSHAMGNSNGTLAEYWQAFESTPGLQGGFLWEWKDHGLRQELAGGRWRYAYGGQFGDEPNDANFVADGLVGPDGTPHPALREVAWVHRPVRVTLAGRSRLRVENRQWFTDLSWLQPAWDLLVDGDVVASGRLRVPRVRPGESAVVALPAAATRLPKAGEAHLTVRWTAAQDLPWADAGHEVAWDQVELRRRRPGRRRPGAGVAFVEGASGWAASAGVTEATVDGGTGLLASLVLAGHETLAAGPRAELWRAPTDNDGLKLLPRQQHKPLARWLAWGLDRLDRELLDLDHRRGVVTAVRRLAGVDGVAALHTQRLRLDRDGVLSFDEELAVPAEWADLPRIGVSFLAMPGVEEVEWVGLGPGENEADRCAGSLLGRWRGPVDELPYLLPQDFGTRGGVRWWEARAGDRAGSWSLRVTAPADPLVVTATHHTADDLWRATDHLDLRRREELVVHVDAAKRGVGTASCGPDTLARYRVEPGLWRWRWQLGPGQAASSDRPARPGYRRLRHGGGNG